MRRILSLLGKYTLLTVAIEIRYLFISLNEKKAQGSKYD
jgi:hypothetical protein